MPGDAKDPLDLSRNFNICLSRRQHAWLRDHAKATGYTVSGLVRNALADTLPGFPAGLE